MLFDIKHSRVGPDEIAETIESLETYRKSLLDVVELNNYESQEASILLPSDNTVYEEVEGVANLLKSDALSYILVIGIGGSDLGAKAVYDALYGHFDVIEPERKPKMLFLDTNNTKVIQKITALLKTCSHAHEFIINIVTKSGSTTETIANAEIILHTVREAFGEEGMGRVVVTTGKGSQLQHAAKKRNIHTLSIPPMVGGRFSVFSAVGLFPLLCAGIDVEAMLEGARDMRDKCLEEQIAKNIALQGASVLYRLRKAGKTILTSFYFHSELRSLGEWYRQLLAESLGKKEDEKGNVVRSGITPEVSVGSTDLHSTGQLYLGGPRDKMTMFVTAHKVGGIVPIPDERVFGDILPNLTEKTTEEIMTAILQGTMKAYEKAELPFMEITLEEISPYELGQFMQSKMCETMYLGELFGINAFDQPNVEEYKSETKKLLA